MTNATIIDRIEANPNPRSWRGRIRACITWGRNLNREAAIDSARNVFAVLGVGTVLGDFSVMRVWMLALCVPLLIAVWFADYLRHF